MTGSLSVTTAHSMTMKFHSNAEMTERASLSFVQSSELASCRGDGCRLQNALHPVREHQDQADPVFDL